MRLNPYILMFGGAAIMISGVMENNIEVKAIGSALLFLGISCI